MEPPVLPSGSAHDMPHTETACVNNIVSQINLCLEEQFDQGDCLFDITICLISSANCLLLLG